MLRFSFYNHRNRPIRRFAPADDDEQIKYDVNKYLIVKLNMNIASASVIATLMISWISIY
jgi:hypothetical protein